MRAVSVVKGGCAGGWSSLPVMLPEASCYHFSGAHLSGSLDAC